MSRLVWPSKPVRLDTPTGQGREAFKFKSAPIGTPTLTKFQSSINRLPQIRMGGPPWVLEIPAERTFHSPYQILERDRQGSGAMLTYIRRHIAAGW